jgi:hypothetical protein
MAAGNRARVTGENPFTFRRAPFFAREKQKP